MSANRETKELTETLSREKRLKRWERRKEMIGLYCEGYSFSNFADQVSQTYGITVNALERDWARRHKWMPILAQVEKPELHMDRLILTMRRIGEAAWQTYRSARAIKNHNAMVGALEKLIRVSVRETELLQSLGVIRKAAEKIDAVITTTGPMPWENIPEVQEALTKLRERMQKEKGAEHATPSA